mmetsp:Transcript_25035/g.72424  ORF Transcript_25035/g.72424 Transcript_25035/m.72424 type:complete len:216 (-) Transcript_25035:620-1267(-)
MDLQVATTSAAPSSLLPTAANSSSFTRAEDGAAPMPTASIGASPHWDRPSVTNPRYRETVVASRRSPCTPPFETTPSSTPSIATERAGRATSASQFGCAMKPAGGTRRYSTEADGCSMRSWTICSRTKVWMRPTWSSTADVPPVPSPPTCTSTTFARSSPRRRNWLDLEIPCTHFPTKATKVRSTISSKCCSGATPHGIRAHPSTIDAESTMHSE